MGYLILACFSVFLLFASGVTQRDSAVSAITQADSSQRQQAAETLRYHNAFNVWPLDEQWCALDCFRSKCWG